MAVLNGTNYSPNDYQINWAFPNSHMIIEDQLAMDPCQQLIMSGCLRPFANEYA